MDLKEMVVSQACSVGNPYVFYVKNPAGGEDLDVKLVMPLGGAESGLYRSPKAGESVLVGIESSSSSVSMTRYLMGYLPDNSADNAFERTSVSAGTNQVSQKMKGLIHESGEVFRYKQTGKKRDHDEDEPYSEIGFYQRPSLWQINSDEQDDYASAPGGYAEIDQIHIHSTGDIRESAVNHHRVKAKRLELLADCDGANLDGWRPFGDTAGDDSNFYAGDTQIRSRNRIILKAGQEIRLQVGRSAIIISDDGITITSKKARKGPALPWDTVVNLTPRDGVVIAGQNVNIGAAYNFSLRESAGGAVSSLGGVMRLSARDLLAQSYCKVGYQANMAEFIKLYTATAKGMAGQGDVPSYTSLLPSLVGAFSSINWGYYASTSNYSDPAGDYAAYCGILLQILSLTYTGLDLAMSVEQKQNGGRDAFNAAALADQQAKVQEMLSYIDNAGDPTRAIHNSFMHLTSSADAVLSGFDNERLSVNIIDSNVPTAGTSGSLIAKETARLQKENSAEASLREFLKNQKNRIDAGALWSLGIDVRFLNKLREL
jgi:hypothetical protein